MCCSSIWFRSLNKWSCLVLWLKCWRYRESCCPVPPPGQGFADGFLQTGKTEALNIMQQSKGSPFLDGSRGDCPCVVPAGLGEKPWLAEGFICGPDAEWEGQKRWTARGKRSTKSPFFDTLPRKENHECCWGETSDSSELARPPLPEQKNTVGGWLRCGALQSQ